MSETWDNMIMNEPPSAKWLVKPSIHLLTPNKIIGGTILIVKKLQAENNNSVYSAFDPSVELPGPPRASNCAIKARAKLDKNGLPLSGQNHLRREVDIHYKVNEHPKIATLFKVIEYSTCSLMVLEYFPDGDLQTVLAGKFGNEEFVKDAFSQVLEAVEFCHSQGVYRWFLLLTYPGLENTNSSYLDRDLKVANFLVNGSRIALADFGHATMKATSKKGGGTMYAMSPGIILAFLISGLAPWKRPCKEDKLYEGYRERGRFGQESKCSDEVKGILAKVLHEDPKKRPNIFQLKIRFDSCDTFVSETPATPDFFS
ncbi:uncharacterized protein PAC_05099 [Phialocephala subalpina]|uniref:Protein kinase domain-containing protein n=1 Tax=Phialocephala subalpina TaxID=576137 RepID=A0A1L7WR32_9HELO|nr:uncharacterized protein PAC_05099 [Phialocephala subalpina]